MTHNAVLNWAKQTLEGLTTPQFTCPYPYEWFAFVYELDLSQRAKDDVAYILGLACGGSAQVKSHSQLRAANYVPPLLGF